MSTNKNTKKKQNSVLNTPMKIVLIVGAVALVGAIVLAIIGQTGVFKAQRKVLTIGDDVIDGVEYSYYYTSTVNSYLQDQNNLYSLYYSGYNFNLTPGRQTSSYSRTTSWKDFFINMTNSGIVQVSVLNQEAQKEGFVGDKEDLEGQMNYYMTSLEDTAKEAGMSVNAYLSKTYGKGMNVEKFKELMNESLYTLKYREALIERLKASITQEQLDKELNDNKNDYTTATYRILTFNFNTDNEEEKAKAEESAAKAMEIGVTEEAFEQFAHDQLSDSEKESKAEDDLTLVSNIRISSISYSDIIKWLNDSSRKAGDVEKFTNTNSISVIYFLNTQLMDYKLRNIRHIYILFEGTEDSDKEATKKKIDDILQEYNAGEKTEERFGALAEKYSVDTDSKTNGGLLENIKKSDYIAALNDWIFDDERQVGDVDSIETTYGYHLVYYVGEGDVCWEYTAKNSITSELYEDKYDEMENGYVINTDLESARRVAF